MNKEDIFGTNQFKTESESENENDNENDNENNNENENDNENNNENKEESSFEQENKSFECLPIVKRELERMEITFERARNKSVVFEELPDLNPTDKKDPLYAKTRTEWCKYMAVAVLKSCPQYVAHDDKDCRVDSPVNRVLLEAFLKYDRSKNEEKRLFSDNNFEAQNKMGWLNERAGYNHQIVKFVENMILSEGSTIRKFLEDFKKNQEQKTSGMSPQ